MPGKSFFTGMICSECKGNVISCDGCGARCQIDDDIVCDGNQHYCGHDHAEQHHNSDWMDSWIDHELEVAKVLKASPSDPRTTK